MTEKYTHHSLVTGIETGSDELPYVGPSTENGHWEVHNPENPTLTPASRVKIARVALALTDRYPDGWHLKVVKTTKRDRFGRIEYFVPDQSEIA